MSHALSHGGTSDATFALIIYCLQFVLTIKKHCDIMLLFSMDALNFIDYVLVIIYIEWE